MTAINFDKYIQIRLTDILLLDNGESEIYNERKKEILSLIGSLKENNYFARYEELTNLNINELLLKTYKQGLADGFSLSKELADITQNSTK